MSDDIYSSNIEGLTLTQPEPEFVVEFRGTDGRMLLQIKPDGTLIVDELKPATETAASVLKLMAKWMPYYMQNKNTLDGDVIDSDPDLQNG